jgi:superfamily II DNA or RNA helicase
MQIKPFIICPKSIISKWREVLEYFDMDYITITNYDSLRNGKIYNKENKLVETNLIKREKNNFTWNEDGFKKYFSEKDLFGKRKMTCINRVLFIFDEVHKCKNKNSINAKLLLSVKKYKVLMLSATICDKNSDFGIFGLMLGFYKRLAQGKNWINDLIRQRKNQIESKNTNILHKKIFPNYGAQMTITDIGEDFPMNNICINAYKLSQKSLEQINKYYQKLELIENYKGKALTDINEIREKIENIKSEIILELLYDYLDKNKSIAVFVNYRSTYNLICHNLKKKEISFSQINGSQSYEMRKQNVDEFQNNNLRVIISMIQAGGESINLHDTTGYFPRVSLISPSYSSIELTQTLGRIYRAGIKSPVIQNIIYCDETYEKTIVERVKNKKDFMKELTDKDIQIIKKSNDNDDKLFMNKISNDLIY